MVNAITTALSGLMAASKKVAASASNIANISTTGSLEDPSKVPYTPLKTEQTAISGGGVKSEFVPKTQPFTPAYEPDSPFANKDGNVGAPNVDLAEEAVNLNIAETAYKASASVIRTQNEMDNALLNIFDKRV